MAETLLQSLTMLAAAALILLVPGLAWLAWFPDDERDPASSLADAVAVSVSFTALAALFAFLLHIRFNAFSMGAVYAILAVLAVAGWLRRPPAFRASLPYLVIGLALLGLLVTWRLFQARTLALPAWVDSVHHVLIVRLFLQNGGIPADFSPYVPVPFSYHYGFHALGALFTAASGAAPEKAVLVFGQVINALVSLQVYRLGRAVWPGVWRALAAALLVGFFSQMPAYYLTWGRYTLLTGLLILPAGMSAALHLARRPVRRETMARLALLTAGAVLSHYLAALLLALFCLVLAVFWLAGALRSRHLDWPRLRSLAVAAAAGFVLALPWVIRVWQFNQSSFQVQLNLSPGAPDETYFPDYLNYLWYLAGPRRNYFLIVLGILGAALALRGPAAANARRLAAWGLGIALLTVPWGLRLGPFRPDHLAIVWFIPVSLFAAHLLVSASQAAMHRLSGFARWLLPVAAGLGLLAWGLVDTASILNPATVITSRADTAALAWIKDNTPPTARFWINVTPWQGAVYRGVDGGWWIPTLTDRGTLLPVVFYISGSPDLSGRINTWAAAAAKTESCTPEFWDTVRQAGLTHVYLKQGAGAFQPTAADACPGLERIYGQDGISIYKVEEIP